MPIKLDTMTFEQLAECLGVTKTTVSRRLQQDPDFPRGYKLGRRRLWDVSEVEAFIDRARLKEKLKADRLRVLKGS